MRFQIVGKRSVAAAAVWLVFCCCSSFLITPSHGAGLAAAARSQLQVHVNDMALSSESLVLDAGLGSRGRLRGAFDSMTTSVKNAVTEFKSVVNSFNPSGLYADLKSAVQAVDTAATDVMMALHKLVGDFFKAFGSVFNCPLTPVLKEINSYTQSKYGFAAIHESTYCTYQSAINLLGERAKTIDASLGLTALASISVPTESTPQNSALLQLQALVASARSKRAGHAASRRKSALSSNAAVPFFSAANCPQLKQISYVLTGGADALFCLLNAADDASQEQLQKYISYPGMAAALASMIVDESCWSSS